jgi:hypothetical protein
MARRRPTATDRVESMTADGTQISVGDLRLLVPDFARALKAANKSPKTVGIYAHAAEVTREQVELSIQDQVERWKPATAN